MRKINQLFRSNSQKEYGKLTEKEFRNFIEEINVLNHLEIDPENLLNRLDPMKLNQIHYSPTIELLSTYYIQKEDSTISLI